MDLPRTPIPYENLGIARGIYPIPAVGRSKIEAAQSLDVELYKTLYKSARRRTPGQSERSLDELLREATAVASENLKGVIRAFREDSVSADDVIDHQQREILTALTNRDHPLR